MAFCDDYLQKLSNGSGCTDEYRIGAGNHYFSGYCIAKRENALNHLSLVLTEQTLFFADIDEFLDFFLKIRMCAVSSR